MSALVTVVAWVALAGWVVAGVLLVLAHRRLTALERAHTARKWDTIALRAELRALRRQRAARHPAAEVSGTEHGTGGAEGGSGPDYGGRPASGGAGRRARGVPTPGATAWRRTHRRPARRRRRS